MKKIWLNHWFSTAYNIINLIKESESEFWIVGSNDNAHAVYKTVCDEWYTEPILNEEDYADYCFSFCKEHKIDAFLPRRGMLIISKQKARFEEYGIRVMADDFGIVSVLNDKEQAYKLFKEKGIGFVPEHYVVTTLNDFLKAYDKIRSSGEQVCFKFLQDEGGKSYRLIDNTRKGYSALQRKQNSRMNLNDVIAALSEKEIFSPIMVMPFLPDEEVSVDCLKTEDGIVMLPRVKDFSRVERIRYIPEILQFCRDFYNKVGLDHPCNIQFKYLHGVPYFLEVNTRMSGGVHMSCLASGVNLPNLAVNQLLGMSKGWKNNYEEKYISHVELPLIV
ncbi:MAG: ATP-grasp domain-containing protein [Clostridiales bacterium]|nr:ATP-grasp domain-containing protein [Clostridiales bacterium]